MAKWKPSGRQKRRFSNRTLLGGKLGDAPLWVVISLVVLALPIVAVVVFFAIVISQMSWWHFAGVALVVVAIALLAANLNR